MPSRLGESGSRVCKGVDANAKPGHAVTAGDAHQTEQKNDDHSHGFKLEQHAEVKNDDDGDESFEDQNELALGDQVGFASLVNQFRDLAHRLVHRQLLQVHVDREAKQQTEHADHQTEQQQRVPIDSQEFHLRQIGQFQVRLAARLMCCGSLASLTESGCRVSNHRQQTPGHKTAAAA